jgi:hypothetical protein
LFNLLADWPCQVIKVVHCIWIRWFEIWFAILRMYPYVRIMYTSVHQLHSKGRFQSCRLRPALALMQQVKRAKEGSGPGHPLLEYNMCLHPQSEPMNHQYACWNSGLGSCHNVPSGLRAVEQTEVPATSTLAADLIRHCTKQWEFPRLNVPNVSKTMGSMKWHKIDKIV